MKPDKDVYGVKSESGHWNGVMGVLEKKKALIAVAPITINYPKVPGIVNTFPVFSEAYTYLYKRPRYLNWDGVFFRPFSTEVCNPAEYIFIFIAMKISVIQGVF